MKDAYIHILTSIHPCLSMNAGLSLFNQTHTRSGRRIARIEHVIVDDEAMKSTTTSNNQLVLLCLWSHLLL